MGRINLNVQFISAYSHRLGEWRSDNRFECCPEGSSVHVPWAQIECSVWEGNEYVETIFAYARQER